MAETFNVGLGLSADSASVKATADTISKDLQKYLDDRLSSNLKFRSMSQVLAQSLNYALEESAKKVNYKGSLAPIQQGISEALSQSTTSNIKNIQANLQQQADALSVKLNESVLAAQKAGFEGAPNIFAKMQGRAIQLAQTLDYVRTVLDKVDFNKIAVGDETSLDLNAIADAFTNIEERAKRAEATMYEARSLMQTAGQLGVTPSVDINDLEGSTAKLKADIEEQQRALAEEAQLRAQETAEMQRQQALSSALLSEQSRMTQLIGDALHARGRLQSEQEHLINMGERESERYQALLQEKEAWKSIIDTIKEYREEIKEMRADVKGGTLLGQEFYKNVSTTTGKVTSNIPTLQEAIEANRVKQVSDSMLSRIRDALSAKGQQSDAVENESEEVKALIAELNTAKDALTQLLNVGGSPTAIVETQAQIQQLEQAITNARNGVQEVVASGGSFPSLLGTANWGQEVAVGMQSANSAMDKTEKEADEVADAIKLIQHAGTECASALRELGVTASEAGDKGEKGANKAKTAHQNFQSTLSSVRYGLSAIGITSSSILGKMVTLVGLVEDAFRGAGSAAQSIIPILGVFLSIGVSVFSTIIKWARKLLSVLTQIGQKIVSIASKGVSVAKKAVTSIADKIKGFIDFFKPSLAKLKKWFMQWGLGARSPYFVIRKIRTMVIDGMKEIAQYSDSVATSMNNFKTALNQVKGSVVSAFEPVASYVLPVLTRLLNILASVLDSIARFNATLLGRSTYFKFVAADVNEYGSAVSEAGKASKKAQKDLMGFDEINRLSAPNEGGSGGAGSASTGKYVETPIDAESGISKWAKKIREAWIEGFYDENGDYVFVKTFEESMRDLYDVFWDIGFKIGVNINSGLLKFNSNVDNYKQTAMKIAQCLAAAINGIVDTPMLGYNIGAAIANVFNIVFSGLHQFATTVHWADIGKFIGDGIAGALTTFDWYQFFDTIVTFINGFFTLLGNIVRGHNWFDIGYTVGDALVKAVLKFDASSAGKSVHDFFDAIAKAIGGFAAKMGEEDWYLDSVVGYGPNGREEKWVKKSGWVVLGEKINKFFKEALTKDLGSDMGDAFGQIATGLLNTITSADFGDAAASFWSGFTEALGQSDVEKALSDFWAQYEPKILSAIDTAIPTLCKAIKRLWEGIKEPVLAIITEIAKVVWEAIQSLIKSGAEKAGKGMVDSALGYDYEEKLKDDEKTREMVYQHENDVYFDKIPDAKLDELEQWIREHPENKRTEAQKEAIKEYERWKSEKGTKTRKDRDKTYDYWEDPLKYAKPQPEVNFDNSELENSSAKIRQEVGETSKAYETSSQTISTANSQIQGSSKFTASAVQDASGKIKQSNQTTQTSFANTASSSVTMGQTISSSTSAMGAAVTAGLQGIQTSTEKTFAAVEPAAQGAYDDMTTTFDGATGYFEDLWATVTSTFQADGDIAKGLAVGIGIVMNTSVNRMIDGINAYVLDPLIRLSNAIELIRSFSFGGLQPFIGLPKLNFIRIPKLAQGAVLPPNQPFLSMVGDQKSGTNVEAPLETIKQAVAEVMLENNDLLAAGFEAVVRAIQNKDMSVRIGDKDIYDANSNYEKRLNIMRGTV